MVIDQHDLGDVILVVHDWLSIARTNCSQQRDQLFVSVLHFTEVDDLLDDGRGNLNF
jgi:hypothetical protein